MTTIAIIGAGAMGAGIGGRLTERGCRVLTDLGGRSDTSRQRATDSGMENVSIEKLAEADLILSIVPPVQAGAVVDRLAPLFETGKAPLFCDANAIAPETAKTLAARVAKLGGTMVDGGIIGAPPSPEHDGPRLYISGPQAKALAVLNDHGVDTRILSGPVGAASALKMCYGGINKGIIGLTAALLLAAQRHGAGDDLRAEFEISQKHLLENSRRTIPQMYPKAYRWDGEMSEISQFLSEDDPAAATIWRGLAEFFTDRSKAHEKGEELAALKALLE
ncbi:NAD(P)-dependent oxidoreductase [Altericroceibacterium spongiae]|uniref:NAD(P)-dependent oxidoreductase n=1 Tax=Altericroceibacterium spongiae TaxID=2320269 RepID=A0A420EFG7_9SPHN|nr:NAD(P)-dependent oxidoreductase [Altericroceibacterium spongiae]RKF19408.1 NAD(P)-dependent oxidoreductase [Altericroceibacterium spongiae]